jgi:hypothetical protein
LSNYSYLNHLVYTNSKINKKKYHQSKESLSKIEHEDEKVEHMPTRKMASGLPYLPSSLTLPPEEKQ